MKIIVLILISILSVSCNSQDKKESIEQQNYPIWEESVSQIGNYVVNVFEDSKGNLWFGTIENGVAKYDGKNLTYFTANNGLPSNRVVGIEEDERGNLWFGTGSGLSKYDGNSFVNFTEEDGLCHDRLSKLFIDRKGVLWIGTWDGVCMFDGTDFKPFPIPNPDVDTPINEDTKGWVTEITEDAEGNIWFARDGHGACKYDGKSFTHILKKDGLHSNNVMEIEFEQDGSIWFGTRVAEKDNPDPKKRIGKGGINKYTNDRMLTFSEIAGFNNGDVYEIYKDDSEILWIGTMNSGVYRFDGEHFKNFDVPVSIMSMTEDKDGNLWLGGAGGLYKIDTTEEIINVTTKGPWN